MISSVALIDYNNTRIKLNRIVSSVSVSNWLDVLSILHTQDISHTISEANASHFCKTKDDTCHLLRQGRLCAW